MGFQFGAPDQEVLAPSTAGKEWGTGLGALAGLGASGGNPGGAGAGGMVGGFFGGLWDMIADEYFPEYETIQGQPAPMFGEPLYAPMTQFPLSGGYLPPPGPTAPMPQIPQSQPFAGGGFLPLPDQSPYMYG